MVRAISQTKAEISAISHPLAEDDQIKSASNELDAIVAATEAATQSILAAGERLELHMRNLANIHHDDEEIVTLTDQMANEVVDTCLQFFGGYGYMLDYPISRAFMDARVQRIFAGTNEIMKVIISKQMGL